ncbi:hypothetical protein [Mycobacterium scrofulaceum]|uniref:hypothetical protein n=1 Tax=Mycobacterium scrofulaceum TaxID=1783 RepID=UPI001301E2B3|nr:hypothetical protein [Mycobacterium scrofulaceum]
MGNHASDVEVLSQVSDAGGCLPIQELVSSFNVSPGPLEGEVIVAEADNTPAVSTWSG